jgi:glycosyltransferase involved in cell wall biosynthesis
MALSSPDSAIFPPQAAVDAPPMISVIVKCLNEEKNIGRCLESLVAATGKLDAEIIVADAGSTDQSVEIAGAFPVRIVTFANLAERGCGATAQLGWQFSGGDYILLIDGDMELMPDFLPAALAALAAEPTLGAVGGVLIEMSDAIEFQERLRHARHRQGRIVPCITGCGLYRAAAIRDAGYFMDRNLHCYEELDLGGRLRAAGWQARLLDTDCVRHFGHRGEAVPLLLQRWRSRTLDGYGEFLRAAWLTPRWRDAVWSCRFALFTIAWWTVLAILAAACLWFPASIVPLLVIAALPPIAQLVRKRRLDRAAYSLVLWQFSGAALLRGLTNRRVAPTAMLRAVVLKEPSPRRREGGA